MESLYKDKNLLLEPPRGVSAEGAQAQGAEQGGLGGQGHACPPDPPLSCNSDPAQHVIDDQYPASVPSTDLTINDVLIAGLGVKTADSCGQSIYTRMVHCSKNPEHDHYQIGGSTCGDPECPVCWSMWAHRGADRISCRVQGFRQFTRVPPRHIILSLGPDDVDLPKLCEITAEKALEILKKVFKKKAESIGVIGGALVVHLWRTNDKVPRNVEVKKWQWVRLQGSGSFKDYTIFEPHAHIAGYGWLVTPEKGEFLYKNKGPLKTREDVERWAYYALSHCPIIPGKKGVIYFGCCSYNKLKPSWMNRVSVDLRCEVCGAPMIYEDNGEVALMRRTYATWIFVRSAPDETLLSPGPPE